MDTTDKKLDLHDSILTKVNIDASNYVITFELDYISGLSETEYVDTFKPLTRKAILTLVNYSKAEFNLACDMKNREIILDFDLMEEKNDLCTLHLYTSNNCTIDICCEKYDFILSEKESIEETLIIIPKQNT